MSCFNSSPIREGRASSLALQNRPTKSTLEEEDRLPQGCSEYAHIGTDGGKWRVKWHSGQTWHWLLRSERNDFPKLSEEAKGMVISIASDTESFRSRNWKRFPHSADPQSRFTSENHENKVADHVLLGLDANEIPHFSPQDQAPIQDIRVFTSQLHCHFIWRLQRCPIVPQEGSPMWRTD